MVDLESCYFCGDADDVQAYAVVPPRFEPTADEQQTVTLCERCYEKLGRVVQPLADRLDAELGDGDAEAGERPPQSAAQAGEVPEESVTDEVAPGGEGIETEPRTGETSGERAAEADEVAAETAAADAPHQDRPAGYRKAMKLLENREFPLDRAEVEGLLGGAYEMNPEEVSAVLEAAVEHGRFVEEGGKLKRP